MFAKALTGRSILLPDGKFLLLSVTNTLTDQRTGAITRYLADGALDTTFNFSRLYKSVSTATPALDGKLYVAATKYLYGKKEAEEILRLNSDGSIDASFNKTVLKSEIGATVQQIRLQPDGKILVAGFVAASFGAGDGIFRLLPDGSIDATFSPITIDGFLLVAVLQPDGRVLIAGDFGKVNGISHPGVARLNSDGSLDSSFQATGFTLGNAIRGMIVQSDGKIVLSGHFRFGTGSFAPRAPLVRLNDTGSIDGTFSSVSTVPSPPTGRELVIQPDGELVAAVNGSVCRFNTDGSRDSSFYSPYFANATPDPTKNPTTESGTALSVNRYADGRILVGGIFTDVDPPGVPGNAYHGVARLNSNGTLDSSLTSSHRTGVETAPSSFARLDDGSTLIGFADKIDPPIANNVGRLLSDGSFDSSFTLSSSAPDSFLSDGFLARGFARLPDNNFFVFGLQAETGVFAYGKVAPNGVHDTAFASEPIFPFQEAIAAPDGKVVLSAGTDARATAWASLARLQADGHFESFAEAEAIHYDQVERLPDFNNIIWRMFVGSRVLAIQPDGKILFVYLGSDQLFHFLRLEDGGSFAGATFPAPDLDENFPYIFDPQTGTTYQPPEGVWTASLPLRDAHIQPDGRIILVGHFTSYNGTAARGIVRLEANGAVDNSFNAGGGAQWTETVETSTSYPAIEQIEVQDDGTLLIAGTFEAFNGVAAPGIALLNPDGAVDTSFVAPAFRDKRSRVASELERQKDGSFLLSGPYTFPNETLSPSFLRLVDLPPMAVNVSTRLAVGTGDDALIEGFIVQGPAGSSKKMMVRALGPSLGQFGVGDALANPTLEIRNSSNAIVATNNDWKTTQIGGLITGDQFAELTASQLAPSHDLESAIIANLEPGSYTAVVRGAGNTTGTGLVDAFDLSPSSSARLANVATRGLIQPGDKLMIAGFIVQNGPINVVVRAIGPSLAIFGISNALPDTTLQLRDQNGAVVLENDDWKSHQRDELEAAHLQPSHDSEAAVITTIQPGQYTAQVRGKGQASGIGVVEVYFPQ
ncbi:MAG TPA: delta-60 repeat domain-containing protein [Chthoniobacterales bacterium]|nr:delta-60 repeat domain-containing protein [Chthoniobacterales bacterium]